MNIGKKILSAFVEVTDEKAAPVYGADSTTPPAPERSRPPEDGAKFRQHFETLFAEANLPGPDYYEFSKMVEAMQGLPDEGTRYKVAFAGLRVQGLDKEKLLATAAAYHKKLEDDAAAFQQSLAAMRTERIEQKQQEREEKARRIEQLSQEITALNNRISELDDEIREAGEKIGANGAGYLRASEDLKAKIAYDVEKIREHLE